MMGVGDSFRLDYIWFIPGFAAALEEEGGAVEEQLWTDNLRYEMLMQIGPPPFSLYCSAKFWVTLTSAAPSAGLVSC